MIPATGGMMPAVAAWLLEKLVAMETAARNGIVLKTNSRTTDRRTSDPPMSESGAISLRRGEVT